MPRPSHESGHQRVVDLFRALGHEGRLAILVRLGEQGAMCAGELQRALGVEQTSLSHQLRILHAARLVHRERRGRHLVYTLADRHVATIVHDARVHVAEI